MEVSIHRLDDIPVYALRTVGEYHIQVPRAWQRLWGWYGTLANKPALNGAYGYDLDNPRLTPADQCRYYACLAIDGDVERSGGIERITIPGGRFAMTRLVGPYDGMPGLFRRLVTEWLPGSGESLSSRDPFIESFALQPEGTPPSDLITDLGIRLA